VNFESLQAIGRNTSNESSTNDFEELDTIFGSGALFDSINRTYSTDGSIPIKTENYTIQGRAVDNVSVADSTAATTSFETGILWDTSDGGVEYSDTDAQTTVWVSKVNMSTSDAYGVYDYLVQIPDTLATTEGATNMVSVYIELK